MTNEYIRLKTCSLLQPKLHIHIVTNAFQTGTLHCPIKTSNSNMFINELISFLSSLDLWHICLTAQAKHQSYWKVILSFFQTHSVSKWKNTKNGPRFFSNVISWHSLSLQSNNMLFHNFVSFFKMFILLAIPSLLPSLIYALRFNKVLSSRSLPELPKSRLRAYYLFLMLNSKYYIKYIHLLPLLPQKSIYLSLSPIRL